jgi:hypothetical protein
VTTFTPHQVRAEGRCRLAEGQNRPGRNAPVFRLFGYAGTGKPRWHDIADGDGEVKYAALPRGAGDATRAATTPPPSTR